MSIKPPAAVGMALAEIDTPALVIDLDAFERNLQRMADFVSKAGVRLRAHAKTLRYFFKAKATKRSGAKMREQFFARRAETGSIKSRSTQVEGFEHRQKPGAFAQLLRH